MDGVGVWLVLVAVPTAAFWGLARALDAWTRSGPPRRTRAAVAPPPPPLERLVADLARLDRECRRAVEQGLPGVRRRATALAYDEALQACCAAVGVPVPPGPLDAVDRLRAEAELAARGITW